ncbi:cytochrome P450 [Enemella sp. A6]|uniref:cytochrome P450 n=1 Tax=Enemella sp. A6 TaxID=3440152 RepID=UPI003EC08000
MTTLDAATAAPIYDPYWPEAMFDPRELYATMHEQGPVHYLPEYDAWAVSGFEALWQIARDTKNFHFTSGAPPNCGLLREPAGASFVHLPNAAYRPRRQVLAPAYRKSSADVDEPYIRQVAGSVLASVLARGDGRMDVFADYTSRVTSRIAGYKVGLPDEDAEYVRGLCDVNLARTPGQKGSTPQNLAGVGEAHRYLHDLVTRARRDPAQARGDLAALLEARIDGEPLTDEQIVADLIAIMITGSETTEIGAAATIYYLAEHPEQLAEVQADHSLIPAAFLETLRYDHPTDLLLREVLQEVEVAGVTMKPGQPVIMMWGAANRDPAEFPNPDVYDIHRRYKRHLLFGSGQHKCLGEFLALRMGAVILEEFFTAIADYTVDVANCTRKSAEFVKGFNSVPITYALTATARRAVRM